MATDCAAWLAGGRDGAAAARAALLKNRGLPWDAFAPWGVGWNGVRYTIPGRDAKGYVQDLRTWHWDPAQGGKGMRSTPGRETQMLGLAELVKADAARSAASVWVCEGEWDAMALDWAVRRTGLTGEVVVVGVPGAGVFKDAWIPAFSGRDVVLAYDADAAGAAGRAKAWKKLQGTAASLKRVEWPSDVAAEEGFDVRDWITRALRDGRGVAKAVAGLRALCVAGPPPAVESGVAGRRDDGHADVPDGTRGPAGSRATVDDDRPAPTVDGVSARVGRAGGGGAPVPRPSSPARARAHLEATFRAHLHLRDVDAIAFCAGVVLAHRLPGDPLWAFVVAPPGGMKSELLMALAEGRGVHTVSTLTAHALVSGAQWAGGGDPSLIPRLDGKVLVIKDFTTILSLNQLARDEIFGQLRDAYDGRFEKQYGNGIVRKYNSRFGILGGVTPVIDTFGNFGSALGERFLRFDLEAGTGHEKRGEAERVRRAIGHVEVEGEMRGAMRAAFGAYLESVPDGVETRVRISDAARERLIALAMLVARLRGAVPRDRYNPGMMTGSVFHEVGTRVGKQLTKLALGLGMYYADGQEWEVAGWGPEMEIVRRAARSSVPGLVTRVVDALYGRGVAGGVGQMRTKDVVTLAGSTSPTVSRVLEDLVHLALGTRSIAGGPGGGGQAYGWALTGNVARMVGDAGWVGTPKTGGGPKTGVVRIRKGSV